MEPLFTGGQRSGALQEAGQVQEAVDQLRALLADRVRALGADAGPAGGIGSPPDGARYRIPRGPAMAWIEHRCSRRCPPGGRAYHECSKGPDRPHAKVERLLRTRGIPHLPERVRPCVVGGALR